MAKALPYFQAKSVYKYYTMYKNETLYELYPRAGVRGGQGGSAFPKLYVFGVFYSDLGQFCGALGYFVVVPIKNYLKHPISRWCRVYYTHTDTHRNTAALT